MPPQEKPTTELAYYTRSNQAIIASPTDHGENIRGADQSASLLR
jgi:hypothetical protein